MNRLLGLGFAALALTFSTAAIAQKKVDLDAAQPTLDAVKVCINKQIPLFDDHISTAHVVASAAARKCHLLILSYAQELGAQQGYGDWWGKEFAAGLEDGTTFDSLVLRYRVAHLKSK